MSSKTGIEWTEATWNPVAAFTNKDLWVNQNTIAAKFIPAGTRGWFCTKVSPGCAHCYAEGINIRLGNGLTYTIRNLEHIEFRLQGLDKPLHWRKPRMIFVNSMTDLFHEALPVEMIDAVFAVMAMTPEHTYQVLTKRAKEMRDYCVGLRDGKGRLGDALRRNDIDGFVSRIMVAQAYGIESGNDASYVPPYKPFPNVWLGVSVEDQERADERIPFLLQTPAAIRFLSCEPLLGNVTLHPDWLSPAPLLPSTNSHLPSPIHWIIVGGESGKNARPMHPDWARGLRDQCTAAQVRFFFKQWGEWFPVGESGFGNFKPIGKKDALIRTNLWPDKVNVSFRVGKKHAGRMLDGQEWNEMPQTRGQPSTPPP